MIYFGPFHSYEHKGQRDKNIKTNSVQFRLTYEAVRKVKNVLPYKDIYW